MPMVYPVTSHNVRPTRDPASGAALFLQITCPKDDLCVSSFIFGLLRGKRCCLEALSYKACAGDL